MFETSPQVKYTNLLNKFRTGFGVKSARSSLKNVWTLLRHDIGTNADDWPVLACATMIGCPVRAEDSDYCGTGVATCAMDRVELYLVN